MIERIERLLEQSGRSFRLIRHADFPQPILNPSDFARALGYDEGRITKTLLIHGGEQFCLAVIPANLRLNFLAVAGMMGAKRCSVAPRADLDRLLGYPPMGVSPLGADGLKVIVDEKLKEVPSILIGSGEAGSEIEIAPADLVSLTGASYAAIT